jgi:5'(3')-deoxyribonucleotidase
MTGTDRVLLRTGPDVLVAVDIDGVLADQVEHVLARAKKEMGVTVSRTEIVAWNTPVGNIGFAELIERYLKDPGFVRSMPEIPGAIPAVTTLARHVTVMIASTRPRETEAATREWLRAHLGWMPTFVNTTGTSKGDIGAQVLIDDGDHNIASFLSRPGRAAILMLRPWNDGPELRDNPILRPTLYRARDWADVLDLFGVRESSPSSVEAV